LAYVIKGGITHDQQAGMNIQYPYKGILEMLWGQSHMFWHFQGYCITLPKPKGKEIPTLGIL
jgi:hypothetical protein